MSLTILFVLHDWPTCMACILTQIYELKMNYHKLIPYCPKTIYCSYIMTHITVWVSFVNYPFHWLFLFESCIYYLRIYIPTKSWIIPGYQYSWFLKTKASILEEVIEFVITSGPRIVTLIETQYTGYFHGIMYQHKMMTTTRTESL